MKKNSYMKIINTCHALIISFLMLFPFFYIIFLFLYSYCTKNAQYLDLNFIVSDNLSLYLDDSILYNLFYEFFDYFYLEIQGYHTIRDLLISLSCYYVYVLAFEFILGLFRKLFNYIMGFIMGGDTY